MTRGLSRSELWPVVMVGDGGNDALALADAVITIDRVDRVATVEQISGRTMRIARQP